MSHRWILLADRLTLMCKLGLASCFAIVLHAKEFGDVFWLCFKSRMGAVNSKFRELNSGTCFGHVLKSKQL